MIDRIYRLLMVRRIFPSFHYDRDIWRANKVRNSWLTHEDTETAGFVDSAEWEEVKENGDDAIDNWVDEQMQNTSVTTVLIGEETHSRKWVNREIEKSVEKNKGIVGIYIHNLEDRDGNTCSRGTNPLSSHYATVNGNRLSLSSIYNTYNWVTDDGYDNLGDWVEEAATTAGR